MSRANQTNGSGPADLSDKSIWEYCRAADATPDEAERFLDLAGFAEARLDDDERERVAAWLAADPDAAADVAAALAYAGTAEAADEAIVARAASLVRPTAEIIPLARSARPRPRFYHLTTWGSLAAAVALAGWLGFALGTDVSQAFGPVAQSSEDSFLGDLIDPAGGVLHTINDGLES